MSTTPRTWVVGEVVTAAELNTEIRDQFNDLLAAWTSYSPAWTAATTNPTLGNGTLTGRQKLFGKTCHLAIELIFGSTTTAGSGSYAFSLPFTAVSSVARVLTGQALSAGGRADTSCVIAASGTTVAPFAPSSTTPPTSQLGSGGLFGSAWATGNTIRIDGTYETT